MSRRSMTNAVHDARGRRVQLMAFTADGRSRLDGAARARVEGRVIAEQAEPWTTMLVIVAGITGATLLAGALVIANVLGMLHRTLLIPLLLSVPVVAIGCLVRFWPTMRSAQAFADAVGAEGHCPCCGYWLGALPREADGCTVCPECGAAWRVSGDEGKGRG